MFSLIDSLELFVQKGATNVNFTKLWNLNKHALVQTSLYFINYIQQTYLPRKSNKTFHLFIYLFAFFKFD